MWRQATGMVDKFKNGRYMTDKHKKRNLQASITVEASLCVPVFFIILFSILYEFSILLGVNKSHIRLADAAANYAVYGTKVDTLFSALGGEHVVMWSENNGYEVCFIRYRVKIPFVAGKFAKQRFYQQIVINGYEGKSMCSEEQQSDDKVYITEKGSVYHVYSDCTYLNPSVKRILLKDIEKERNLSGGKYKQCEFCFKSGSTVKSYVYVTNYGDRYHLISKCHGIKRNVRIVRKSEIGDMSECNKCKKRSEN